MDILLTNEVPQYVQEFIRAIQDKGRKSSTVKRYIYDLIDFLNWLEYEKGGNDFDYWLALEVEDYNLFFNMVKSERGCSKRTLHRFRTVLNQLALYYKEKGYDICTPGIITLEDLTKEMILKESDFVNKEEMERLKASIISPTGLSEKKLLSRPFLINRNISIITLFVDYGLTMSELSDLTMKDINLAINEIKIWREGYKREIKIDRKDGLLLNYYIKDIPKAVRPRTNENDPFFVAFDYYRGTYHWDYENKSPKKLTEVAIQKMIRGEIKKAKFDRQVTARNLRNASILNEILKGTTRKELFERFGFKTEWYINRFLRYAIKIEPELKHVYYDEVEKNVERV